MASGAESFEPTHTVPPTGLSTWVAANPNSQVGPWLPPDLEVQVIEQTGAWARVRCSNEFTAWVDGRALVALVTPAPPPPPPAAAAPAVPATPPAPTPAPVASAPPAAVAVAVASPATLDTTVAKVAALDFSFSKPLVGAGLVALAGLMPWFRLGGGTSSGFDISVVFLFNLRTRARGGLSVGLLMLAAAVVAA